MADTFGLSRSRAQRTFRQVSALALSLTFASGATFGALKTAHAEDVSPTGKGVVGGALLGGEVVVFAEGILGVRSGLAYIIGAGLGAGGGGVGGYYLEQSSSDGRIPAYVLAGGLALLIPAFVVALDQTRYLPAEGAREDRAAPGPSSDPGQAGGASVVGVPPAVSPAAAPQPPTPAVPAATPAAGAGGSARGATPAVATLSHAPRATASLVNVSASEFRVGLPIPEVRPVFTASQKKALGVEAGGNEIRFPVVAVAF